MPSLFIDDPALRDPPLPLPAAARQLYSAVCQGITYFEAFQQSYRKSIKGVRAYGDSELLNRCWTTQIHTSMSDPTRASGLQKSADRNDPNDQMYGQSHNQSHSQTQKPDLVEDNLSFPQHQRRILERIDALRRSCYPRMLEQAAAAKDGDAPWLEPELYANRLRHGAAEKLKRRVENSSDDVKYAIGGMRKDYLLAKDAMRELKSLRQDLTTYKACWDKNWEWEKDDGGESDQGYGDDDGQ